MSAVVREESGPSSADLREACQKEITDARCNSNVALVKKKQVAERNAAAQKQKATSVAKQYTTIDDQKQWKAQWKREADKRCMVSVVRNREKHLPHEPV